MRLLKGLVSERGKICRENCKSRTKEKKKKRGIFFPSVYCISSVIGDSELVKKKRDNLKKKKANAFSLKLRYHSRIS